MPRPNQFRLLWYKWYIVDLRNWYKPAIVRKHLDSRQQAKRFLKTYFNRDYDIIRGREAINMGIKPKVNMGKRNRHNQSLNPKYEYPPHIKTKLQKKIYRGNRRREMKANKNKPKLTVKVLKDILDNNISLFFKRLKRWDTYYQAYSKPVTGFYVFKKEYIYPAIVVRLSAIRLCLDKYYDTGNHDPVDVAMFIYDGWPERVMKRLKGGSTFDKVPSEVKQEFIARGFIKGKAPKYDMVETMGLKATFHWPDMGWHNGRDIKDRDKNIYELQALVGICGYTKSLTKI